MIFNTITNDLNGAINKIGIFNRSFADLKNAISINGIKGLFNSLLPAITSSDISLIKEYNRLVGVEGVSSQSAWYKTMLSSSKSVQALFDDKSNLIETNNGLILSEETLTRATNTMTIGAKAGKITMQAFATAGNMLAGFLISKGIEAAATAIDNYVHRVEKANEAMDNAVSAYASAKSSLDSINSELDEHMQKISELESKDKLTYAEKGQLDELKAITNELLLQQSINEKEADKISKEAADKTVDAYKKQYGKYDISKEGVEQRFEYNDTSAPKSEDDITGYIASYINVNSALEDAKEKRRNILNADANADVTSLDEEIQDYIDASDLYSDHLDSSIADLQEKRLALEDEYQKNIEKDQNGVEISTSDREIIDTYNAITDNLKTIYEFTNPNEWNSMQISDIFSTKDIEKTKDELIELEKAGKLSPEVLESYPKLSSAIKDSELIAGEGSDAFKEFYNEIAALADKQGDVLAAKQDTFKSTKSSMIDSINALSDGFDTIGKIYSDVKDGGTFDFSLLDSKSFKETFSGLDKEYNAFIEKVASSPDDIEGCQDAFNSLISKWIESEGILKDLTKENAQTAASMLENMGVANAQELVYSSLNAKTDALALKEQLLAETGGDLTAASSDKVLAFLEQAGASEAARNYLIKLIAEEQIFSNQDLDVSEKISKLKKLAENYGQTALAAKIAAQETAYEESGTGENWSEADLQKFQEEWNKNLNSITIDFSLKDPDLKNPKTSKLEELESMRDS